MKNKGKIRKLLSRQGKTTALPVILVGPKAISPHSVEEIRKSKSIWKWKLDKKIYVSGHWRSQWYGSDKEGTRRRDLIFIQPYEKGPEFAEMINRKYQVGTA